MARRTASFGLILLFTLFTILILLPTPTTALNVPDLTARSPPSLRNKLAGIPQAPVVLPNSEQRSIFENIGGAAPVKERSFAIRRGGKKGRRAGHGGKRSVRDVTLRRRTGKGVKRMAREEQELF